MGLLEQFDAFHDMASAATGLDDFGAPDYHDAMRLLLGDLDRHANLNANGIAMFGGETVGRLVGRLMTEQGLKQHPHANGAPLVRPLVVIGMARTGTTALQRLLSQDADLQSLPLWLGSMPQPRPPRESWEGNPCYRQVAQGLEQFYAQSPDIRAVHPMAADEPDECRLGLNHTFWSTDSSTTAIVPQYADFVFNGDARYAYRYYRRLLNLIAANDPRRWLLKDVCHLFNLDAFLDVFPDACIVYTHRDPVVSLTSVASLIYLLRRMREDKVDPIAHGRFVLDTWTQAMDRSETVRRRYPAAQFIDVHNEQIQTDPLGTVERIYRHFDLPISEGARAAWRQKVTQNPRSGHGRHDYRPEDFGLSPKAAYDAIGPYYERYREVAKAAGVSA